MKIQLGATARTAATTQRYDLAATEIRIDAVERHQDLGDIAHMQILAEAQAAGREEPRTANSDHVRDVIRREPCRTNCVPGYLLCHR